MADYIPRDKATRYQWLNTFRTNFEANAVALGYTAADAAALTALWEDFQAAYDESSNKENAYRAGVATLDGATEALIADVRLYAGAIQMDPAVTDAMRSSAGLPIRSTARTPAGVPTSRPIGEVDTSQRLQHTIAFRDEGSTSRAKPDGVRGAEIWCAPVPGTVADARYLATDTASPYLATYPPADAGKSMQYFLRWVNTRGQPGPWSETITATIPG